MAGLPVSPILKFLKKKSTPWSTSCFPASREALITTSTFLVFWKHPALWWRIKSWVWEATPFWDAIPVLRDDKQQGRRRKRTKEWKRGEKKERRENRCSRFVLESWSSGAAGDYKGDQQNLQNQFSFNTSDASHIVLSHCFAVARTHWFVKRKDQMCSAALCVPGADRAGGVRRGCWETALDPALGAPTCPCPVWLELLFTPAGTLQIDFWAKLSAWLMQRTPWAFFSMLSMAMGSTAWRSVPPCPCQLRPLALQDGGKAGGIEPRLSSHVDLGLNPSCPTDSLL